MEQPVHVGYAIKGLSNQVKRVMDKRVHGEEEGLTGMQFGVLGYLARTSQVQDVFQKDLEVEFNIRRSTASGILQLMEKKGFIRRIPVDYDARLKKIVLTEKAIAHHEQVTERISQVEEAIVQGMTDEEIATLFSLMDKISHNLDELYTASEPRK